VTSHLLDARTLAEVPASNTIAARLFVAERTVTGRFKITSDESDGALTAIETFVVRQESPPRRVLA
jgi:hypothetical protein